MFNLCAASCSISVAVTAPIGHLLPSMRQYGERSLITALVQQFISFSNLSEASWIAFGPVQLLDLPSPSAVSANCQVGLCTVAFHHWCFLPKQQDPSVNKTYCFSFSCSWLYLASSTHVISSSHSVWIKSLPLDQSMITSEILGWLRFPLWAHCVISASCLVCVASVVQHVERTFHLNIQLSTNSWSVSRCHVTKIKVNLKKH